MSDFVKCLPFIFYHPPPPPFQALSVPLFRKEMQQYLSWRLEELTEKRIGSLMRRLIYKHLGWIIVWGCVFGILTGVVVQGLKISLNFNFFLKA